MQYTKKAISIGDYVSNWYNDINCSPIGQRLPVTEGSEKRDGIINTILQGIDIGQITIAKNDNDPKYEHDSVDGGHRKRYIHDYKTNKFKVNGKFFKELTQEEKDKFNAYELMFVIYEKLDVFTKGYIFRTINETTDVNDQETLNSYGDIPIANLIRNLVRVVPGVDNITHPLFEITQDKNFRFLNFDNARLKTEEMVARIVYRYTQDTKLGSSSYEDLDKMYKTNFDEGDFILLEKNVKLHFDYILKCANAKKTHIGTTLSMQDFKMLSFIRYYLLDTVGSYSIPDYEKFIKSYNTAMKTLQDKDHDLYGNVLITKDPTIDFDSKQRTIAEAFKNYLGAPHHEKKIKKAVDWLLLEFNYQSVIEVLDSKRNFTKEEKELRLAQQDYKCSLDGQPLLYGDAEAAHIIAHKNGGKTIMSNMVMVRREHNRAMGTMDLEDYRKILDNAVAS
jgi:hypothetical protein|tara:strand:- start:96 stop:1442 length:1347 start_codon:yes stop_codon:yes gene_type:complete